MGTFLRWLRSLPLPAWLAGMLDARQAGGEEDPRGAGVPLVPNPVVGAPGSVAPAVPEAPAGAAPRRINAAGLALVKASEGLRLTAYRDSGGVWTIGYGHTGTYAPSVKLGRVNGGDTITEAQAEAQLFADLESAEWDVSRAAAGMTVEVPLALTDNQFSALVSFTFNLGGPALLKLLSHGVDQVPSQLLRWDRIGEREIPGLLARRQREAALWST